MTAVGTSNPQPGPYHALSLWMEEEGVGPEPTTAHRSPGPQVLRQFSINLSEEEFFHVLEYYDKSLSSKISYNDFLRAFLQ